MRDEERIIRVKTLVDFNRELGRDGGEGHGGILEQLCSESLLRQASSWRRS